MYFHVKIAIVHRPYATLQSSEISLTVQLPKTIHSLNMHNMADYLKNSNKS